MMMANAATLTARAAMTSAANIARTAVRAHGAPKEEPERGGARGG